MPVSTSKEPAKIAGMFDAIASSYDRLNHLLSAGFDRRWRRWAVQALELSGRERVLDMCSGTADLAIEAATASTGHARVVIGIDFAGEMLRLGLAKVRAANLHGRVCLARGDATRVPCADASFDAAMVAFGIRNVIDPAAACAEFARVLRPGGRLAILEFGSPSVPGLREIYNWYFRVVLPRIGRLISRHGDAYAYLPASVAEFPSPSRFSQILQQSGFGHIRCHALTMGVVYLYVAERV